METLKINANRLNLYFKKGVFTVFTAFFKVVLKSSIFTTFLKQ